MKLAKTSILLVFLVLSLSRCGSNESSYPSKPEGAAGPIPANNGAGGSTNAPPICDKIYKFASNTVCQVLCGKTSAKKPSSSSSALKIYLSDDCSGSTAASIDAVSNPSYTSPDAITYTVSGNNASGLTLHVVQ